MNASLRQTSLLLSLWIRREIRSRYAGSVLGLIWAILLPLITMVLYYLVFAVVLSVRIPELAGASGYFYYLLAGLLPWLTISEGVNRSVTALVAQEQFLQKIVFPVWILPTSVIGASLIPQIVGFIALLALLAGQDLLTPAGILSIPLLFMCQLVIMIGLGLSLSVLGVHLRDLGQLVPVCLQLLFYASPILYPKSLVPEAWHWVFALNPFGPLIDGYQAALLGFDMTTTGLLALAGWTVLLGGGGIALFLKLKPTLGDQF